MVAMIGLLGAADVAGGHRVSRNAWVMTVWLLLLYLLLRNVRELLSRCIVLVNVRGHVSLVELGVLTFWRCLNTSILWAETGEPITITILDPKR